MHEILTLLFICFFVGTIVLVINPKILPVVDGVPPLKRWQIAITGILGMLLVSFFFGSNNETQTATIAPEEKPKEESKQAPIKDLNLGLSVEQFKKRFNAKAKDNDFKFHISDIKIDRSQPVHTFNIELSKNQGIIGSVNDKDVLTGINTISTGDGSLASGANMLYLAICIVNTFNPDGSKEDNAKFTLGLFKQAADGEDGKSHDQIIDDKVYTSMRSKSLGFWFSVYPKD